MRTVVQRVKRAMVEIEMEEKSSIEQGLLVFLGVARDDTRTDGEWLAKKIINMRIFNDTTGRMNRSLRDIDGEILVVSQFTLLASMRKGTRPSFNASAAPGQAMSLYKAFVDSMERLLGKTVPTGKFGAAMQIELVNDGPVTIFLDSQFRE